MESRLVVARSCSVRMECPLPPQGAIAPDCPRSFSVKMHKPFSVTFSKPRNCLRTLIKFENASSLGARTQNLLCCRIRQRQFPKKTFWTVSGLESQLPASRNPTAPTGQFIRLATIFSHHCQRESISAREWRAHLPFY